MEFKFAFATFYLIFFILFPGIIIKRSFFRGEFSKQFNQGEFSDRIITTFFWGFICQILILYLFNIAVDTKINSNFITTFSQNLLTENPNIEFVKKIDDNDLKNISIYFLFLLIIPFLLGFIAHKIIRITSIDTINSSFRFSNYWFYYYSGEVLKRPEFKHLKSINNLGENGIEEVFCDILISLDGDKTALYSGKFSQYTICKSTNKLENIFLTNVERYSSSAKQFKRIKSDIMLIPCERLINLNIRYIAKKQSKLFRVKNNLLLILFLILLVTSILYPWLLFISNSFLKNFVITILSLICSLFFVTLISALMFKEIKINNKGNFYSGLTSIILALLIIILKMII